MLLQCFKFLGFVILRLCFKHTFDHGTDGITVHKLSCGLLTDFDHSSLGALAFLNEGESLQPLECFRRNLLRHIYLLLKL